jgi:hypothetical protein
MLIFNFFFHVLDVTQKAKGSNTTKLITFFVVVSLLSLYSSNTWPNFLPSPPFGSHEQCVEARSQFDSSQFHAQSWMPWSWSPHHSSNTTTLNLTNSPTATLCPHISWLSQARRLSPLAKPTYCYWQSMATEDNRRQPKKTEDNRYLDCLTYCIDVDQ